MLVLTRKPYETIHIGDDIVITILAVDGCKVRVGVDAKSSTTIWRGELKQAIDAGEKPVRVADTVTP